MPSRRQSSLTATSRRNPSSTIRTFSSGVYFRLDATLTCCIKPLVCWVLASAAFRILVIIDEYTRECLAMLVARHITSVDVIEQLYELFLLRGVPEHIRSDNGPEFTAKAVRSWLNRVGVKTLFIEPGSPWENGYVESFNSKLRDELLNGEVFTTLTEAKIIIEQWRREYNQVRPHSALGYQPPAPEAIMSLTLT
jgi:putative transposase